MVKKRFIYVKIPADDSKPIEELSLKYTVGGKDEIPCLTKALQDYYKKATPPMTKEQK